MNANPSEPHIRRADWLRVLARATATELAQATAALRAQHAFEWLRQPEQGLVMVRARIGNTGDRYNVGEATVTRCALRHRASDGSVVVGLGHVLGLDDARAEHIAQLDALLQLPTLHAVLWASVVEPLRLQRAQRDQQELASAQASRVRFFTLQPEAA